MDVLEWIMNLALASKRVLFGTRSLNGSQGENNVKEPDMTTDTLNHQKMDNNRQ